MHVYCLVSSPFSLAFVLFLTSVHVIACTGVERSHLSVMVETNFITTCDIGQCSLELLCQSISLMP